MAIKRLNDRKHIQRGVYLLFSILVAAAIFTYLFSTVSPGEVVDVLRGITVRWVLLFLLFSFSMSLFRTWRYAVVLQVSGYRPDAVALYLITLVRNFFSDLLPARLGTLIYIYLVQTRLGIPFGPTASSFAHAFIFDMVSLALLIILAVFIQSSELISPLVVGAGGLFLGAASIGVLLALPLVLRVAARLCLSVAFVSGKMRQKMHDGLAAAEHHILLTKKHGIYWQVFALSLGVRCCKYLSLYVLLLALVVPLGFPVQSFPLAKVFLGLCSAELAASLPVSGIAGFGAYEGAWALVFQLLGYSERIAVLTSISHHLLTQVYGYSLGAVALLILLLPLFKKESQAAAPGKTWTGRLFWPKFVVTALGVFALAFLLFPERDKAGSAATVEEGISAGAAAGEAGRNALAQIAGKVVYQRPDGIYVVGLHGDRPRRIVENGSYPRWSPDGRLIAFVRGNAIMTVAADGGKPRQIAEAQQARAVCFAPDGRAVFFSDGNRLRRVALETPAVSEVLQDGEFREIDVAAGGRRLAATIRTPFGLKVRAFDLRNGASRTVASGCSASMPPDGTLITVNGGGHERLFFHRWDNLHRTGFISAPPGMQFDNQYWSNHRQWIVSIAEGTRQDVYVHHVPSDTAYRVTDSGDCVRADLHVAGAAP